MSTTSRTMTSKLLTMEGKHVGRWSRGHANHLRQRTQGTLAREHVSLQATLTREYISTQSMLSCEYESSQNTLAHERVSMQGTLAREHVSTQVTLPLEPVSTQGMLTHEHVSTKSTLGREHARHVVAWARSVVLKPLSMKQKKSSFRIFFWSLKENTILEISLIGHFIMRNVYLNS